MDKVNFENISKDVLRWSYRRAGLTEEQAFSLFPLLEEWLNGVKKPTISQLKEYGSKVYVPLGFLYLGEPPVEKIPFPIYYSDFMEDLGNAGVQEQGSTVNHFDLDVYDTVLEIQRRQDWLEDYLSRNGLDTCGLVGTLTLNNSIAEAVDRLRNILNLPPNCLFDLSDEGVVEGTLDFLTTGLEKAGVFVSFNDIVGSDPRRPLKVEECRGFTLANKVAPYIFINSSVSVASQVYTLINECAHLMLGLSVGHAGGLAPVENEEEVFCDRMTIEFLFTRENCHYLQLLAKGLKRNPRVSYLTDLKRIGKTFALHVNNAVQNRMLSYTDAYRLTSLYGSSYQNFMAHLFSKEDFYS